MNGERNIILMNKTDIKALTLEAGQLVDVTSLWPDQQTLVPYDIPKGNITAYFPEANP